MSRLLVKWNAGRLEIIVSMIMHRKKKLNKYYAEIFSETTGIEILSQHWCENRQLSMEGIAVEYFPNLIDPGSKKIII